VGNITAIVGFVSGIIGAAAAVLAIPPETMHAVQHTLWRAFHSPHLITAPTLDGLGFDRCYIYEEIHHCEPQYTKMEADAVCRHFGFDQAEDNNRWTIHQVKSDWIYNGYSNGIGGFLKTDDQAKLVHSRDERDAGKEFRPKVFGIFDVVECD
jgi:hypothetical protein